MSETQSSLEMGNDRRRKGEVEEGKNGRRIVA
jgi:hypothetical protein